MNRLLSKFPHSAPLAELNKRAREVELRFCEGLPISSEDMRFLFLYQSMLEELLITYREACDDFSKIFTSTSS